MRRAPGPVRVIFAAGVAATLWAGWAHLGARRPSGAGRTPAGSAVTPRATAPTGPAAAPPPSAEVAAGAPDAAPPARPVIDGPQRILLFGDSMVPALAPRLGAHCQESGHTLFPVVWYGSTIIRWAKGDALDQLLVETQPTLVIAVMGASELTVRDVGECEPFVHLLARKVGARPLLWIGPPNWRDDTGVNAMLERALGPGWFFRSSALDLPRRIDGIHPSDEGGAAWVDAFVRWVRDESASPIRFAAPRGPAPAVPVRVLARR